MTTAFVDRVRDRVMHSLEPGLLAQAAMTIPDAQQFIARRREPSEDQLVALALQLQVSIPEDVLERWRSRRGAAA
jgi:hypothetical protein